ETQRVALGWYGDAPSCATRRILIPRVQRALRARVGPGNEGGRERRRRLIRRPAKAERPKLFEETCLCRATTGAMVKD
ncbi:MAG: hypothetical protein ACWGQW_22845, partial [bacterium]